MHPRRARNCKPAGDSRVRDLVQNPAWREEDLGLPIPDSPHACSVALPLWEHVVGYEEEDPALLSRLQSGYPRFFWNPAVDRLFARCREQFAADGEGCFVFPSERAAERCAAYLRERGQTAARLHPAGRHRLTAVCFPQQAWDLAKEYWRYSGEIVSSRQAHAALHDQDAAAPEHPAAAMVRDRLAALTGQHADDVFLFPSGMSAVFTVHRMLMSLFPGRKSVQMEFPYVDVLRVQRAFGPGVHFFARAERVDVEEVTAILDRERLSAVFCELASNPLMRSADVAALAPVARAHDTPVIVDDTIATSVNIDAFQVADAVTTSLTKFFSGTGDVMAGSVIVRRDSPFHAPFTTFLKGETDNTLWHQDAEALELNSRDFAVRMRAINLGAEAVYDFLAGHPAVERVFYPKGITPDEYRQLARPDAGYGGLISLVLRHAESRSPEFYDRLRISKGPSLGTNFSLACPYTLLAHYRELDWARSCGVSPHLIRLSVGLEEPHDLLARLEEALPPRD